MNKEELDVAVKTREIYKKQHNNYLTDTTTFDRFLKMISDPSYFNLTEKDFQGKSILDAGCGNTGYFQVGMSNLGVGEITCLDLGDEWIPPLKTFLDERNITNVNYVPGSTDNLPFDDESFDIVFSNGVLMHLVNEDQIERAFSELSRVTKKGGHLYIVSSCPGGLIEEEIIPALRNYYSKNEAFKTVIDNLTPESFGQLFELIAAGLKKHQNEDFNPDVLNNLFDIDFCTTVQNILQVPKRWILNLSEEFLVSRFEKNGFEDIKRCKRYVERHNIRKFFAPLHYDNSSVYSEILYGCGNIEMIASKKL